MIEYSYAVLKYRHDLVAGEVLNVGVVLFAGSGHVGFLASSRYGRLSEAFAGFDGEMYKSVVSRMEIAFARFSMPMHDGLYQLEERERFGDVGDLVRIAWPDQGLSYFAGPVQFGLTNDVTAELKELYDRFVLSQFDRRDAQSRFDDDALWSDLKRVLAERGITRVLHPMVLGPSEIEFQHAYKNGKWHVIEAVSLDYANAGDIKQRALLAVGKAAAVRGVEEFGSMTVIVGKPKRISSEKSYANALRLLRDMPVKSQIVLETDADQFAAQLEQQLLAYGLLSEAGRDLLDEGVVA